MQRLATHSPNKEPWLQLVMSALRLCWRSPQASPALVGGWCMGF